MARETSCSGVAASAVPVAAARGVWIGGSRETPAAPALRCLECTSDTAFAPDRLALFETQLRGAAGWSFSQVAHGTSRGRIAGGLRAAFAPFDLIAPIMPVKRGWSLAEDLGRARAQLPATVFRISALIA
ncbi:MAG: hypothetical protein ABI611_08220 [Solirubrobacteraceae bacterium]